LLYLTGPKYMAKWWMGILVLVAIITIHFVIAFRYRKAVGGFMSYWQGYLASFGLSVMGAFIGVLFNALLFGVIDPDLNEKIKNATMENTIEMLESFNMPQEDIDKALDGIEKSFAERDKGMVAQAIGFFWQLVIAAIFAFIVAAFLRKNPPADSSGTLDTQAN
jgi:hypothetical protein